MRLTQSMPRLHRSEIDPYFEFGYSTEKEEYICTIREENDEPTENFEVAGFGDTSYQAVRRAVEMMEEKIE